jgi:O-antigen/teichoic acid export membrane protein
MNDAAATVEQIGPDFGSRVKSAVFWRSGTQILSQLISWGATLAVIRILDPHDYGLFAMTSVVLVFLNFLNGYGLVSALIRSPTVEPVRIRQAFGMLILINSTLAITQYFAVAPLAAAYYGEAIVADLLRWQALIYLSTPFVVLPESMLTRNLDFRKPAMVNLTVAVIGASASLYMAMNGYGVWTLVFAPIAMFWARAILLIIVTRFRLIPSFDFRGSGSIFGFGLTMLASHGLFMVQTQSDIFIAARHVDAHLLGIYAEALFVAQLFATKFIPPLNEVAFPAYSRMQDNKAALSYGFLKAVRLIMLVACPLYFGMAISAEPFVHTLLGRKWTEAIPIVTALALAMPFLTLQTIFHPAINALSGTKVILRNAVAGALIMPVTYLVAVQYGIAAMAWSWLVSVPLLLAITVFQMRPVLAIRARDLMLATLPGFGAALVMSVAVWTIDHLVMAYVWRDIPAPLHLVVLTVGGALTYGALLYFGARATFDEVMALLLRRKAA